MMRRLLAAASSIAVAAALASTWAPTTAQASSSLACPTPSISQVNPQVAGPGSTVTISGSGFTGTSSAICTLSLYINNRPLNFSYGSPAYNSITFVSPTSPPWVDGAVRVRETDATGSYNDSNSNLYFTTTPAISSLSPSTPAVGQAMTVSGSGLDGGGDVQGVSATFYSGGSPCQSRAATVSSSSAIGVTAPSHYCYGALQLTFSIRVNSAPAAATSVTLNAGSVDVAASVAGLSPPTAAPGQSVTVSGSGFGYSGSATVGGTPASSSWNETSVAVTVPGGASSGAVLLQRAADGAVINAGTVTVPVPVTASSAPTAAAGNGVPTRGVAASPLPHIASIVPSHAPVNGVVQVTGSGFGAQQGTVTIGGSNAPVTLWSDGDVAVTVPSDVKPGATRLTLLAPGTAQVASFPFTIDPGVAPPPPTPSALAPPIAPQGSGPIVTHGGSVDFHPKPKPPSPINLTLHPDHDRASPGSAIPFTARLVAYGKPVPGASIGVQLVIVPGSDAHLTPSVAVTDNDGAIHGTIYLSQTAGDHIVLAQSGIYNDEVRIIGGDDSSLASALTSAGPVKTTLVLGLIGCIVLFFIGLGVNLATTPVTVMPGTLAARLGPFGHGMLAAKETTLTLPRLLIVATLLGRHLAERSAVRARPAVAALESLVPGGRRKQRRHAETNTTGSSDGD
ncbi:MAG TPA: IPT/TIG domain-containing protein [Candidatus Sulfotelmatobacter sp.]|nr:IPT/TIG domain-containing protein [Candidatus Sulfotelmatobacter sp.]